MSESQSHKRAKAKASGKSEVGISGGRRLDSASAKTATEVERNKQNLDKAAQRLKASGRPRKVLQVRCLNISWVTQRRPCEKLS